MMSTHAKAGKLTRAAVDARNARRPLCITGVRRSGDRLSPGVGCHLFPLAPAKFLGSIVEDPPKAVFPSLMSPFPPLPQNLWVAGEKIRALPLRFGNDGFYEKTSNPARRSNAHQDCTEQGRTFQVFHLR